MLSTIRDRGSVHSDVWRGPAADLAGRDAGGAFPVNGWCKEKPRLQRWERSARSGLPVSIRPPEAEIDIHTPSESQLVVEVPSS